MKLDTSYNIYINVKYISSNAFSGSDFTITGGKDVEAIEANGFGSAKLIGPISTITFEDSVGWVGESGTTYDFSDPATNAKNLSTGVITETIYNRS